MRRRRVVRRPSRPIRGVLFDKDGTLLDYARTWPPINREAAIYAAGGDVTLAGELLTLGGQDPATGRVQPGSVLAVGTHEEIAAVFAGRLRGRTPPGLAEAIAHIFCEGGARHAVLVEGALAALRTLAAAGLRLGVATNDGIGGLRASLGRHPEANALLEFQYGCDSGHGAKPSPGMALAFCAAAGLEPASIAVVGDGVHDLEMGRRAGAGLRVGVLGGTSGRADLAPYADLMLASVADLPAHLAPAGP